MMISPFTPLFFIHRKSDGVDSEYMQTFSTSDRILLQIFGSASVMPSAYVVDELGGATLYKIDFNHWAMNDDVTLWFTTITLSSGIYSVYIEGIGKSELFQVTADRKILARTTLIQYSARNNRQRTDVVFFIDGMQYFFDFRVPGGFKDSNWTFSVESEQFMTQNADVVQLYNLEATQKKFTLGSSMGVPIWFGEMLNRILTCSHVYFDGIKYCRKESGVPELTIQLDGVNSYVFTQALQQSVNLDPVIEQNNRAIIRRADANTYRAVSQTIRQIV